MFASSVASGFEGLAVSDWQRLDVEAPDLAVPVQLKPLEGAEAGGVGGFFKGVGKVCLPCCLCLGMLTAFFALRASLG